LDHEKFLWNTRSSLLGIVDDDWQQKGVIVGHIEGPFDGQSPLSSKITFVPGLGLGRYECHEIVAIANLLADLLIPCFPAA
jgi:hypothetical protein